VSSFGEQLWAVSVSATNAAIGWILRGVHDPVGTNAGLDLRDDRGQIEAEFPVPAPRRKTPRLDESLTSLPA
jgi:hypothetical protein